jgi:hypothetical protein
MGDGGFHAIFVIALPRRVRGIIRAIHLPPPAEAGFAKAGGCPGLRRGMTTERQGDITNR